uniref:Protein kinase domain-containing protein n=1 Tax=Ananas comosus var. bracteatus TaxID=296719 RepID=A0A6V7QAH0_ANACO|nr:unnamed protein product [Ananas comosus var. bracteatus]
MFGYYCAYCLLFVDACALLSSSSAAAIATFVRAVATLEARVASAASPLPTLSDFFPMICSRGGVQPVSWAMRVNIATDVARGLSFLHRLDTQVIFRDLKSSNVLLDSDFRAKLLDFGLARNDPAGDKSHVSTQEESPSARLFRYNGWRWHRILLGFTPRSTADEDAIAELRDLLSTVTLTNNGDEPSCFSLLLNSPFL